MSITMIAMLEMSFGIGDADGNLLFHLPKDISRFKSITTGKHVVMGRKTWDSLPIKPLPKRKNYVLTRDETFEIQGKTKVLHSIEEVLELSKNREVFIIGGGEIYKQFMPYTDKMLLTHVHTANFNARAFFPEFDFEEWRVIEKRKQEADKQHEFSFTFATYKRVAPSKELQAEDNTVQE